MWHADRPARNLAWFGIAVSFFGLDCIFRYHTSPSSATLNVVNLENFPATKDDVPVTGLQHSPEKLKFIKLSMMSELGYIIDILRSPMLGPLQKLPQS
jgi:hypothetical protein